MDLEENDTQLQYSKINICEVCSKNEAKYTCPRCELRTCSLECIKIHKKELECSGLRDKVKFKMLRNFDNIDLLNDYRLLEETARVVNKSVKLPAKSCYNERSGTLPTDLYRLKCTAQARGIQLHFLPPNFSRHQTNTSYLDHDAQDLYWRIDWVFPQAGNISFTDERVLDSSALSASVHKYLEPEDKVYPSLPFYQAAGHAGIKLLLKAERTAPNRYYLLDPTTTLRENLMGKSIIEYPMIYVILSDHIYMYNIFREEEEHNLKRKWSKRHHSRNRQKKTSDNNYLFSKSNDCTNIESDEEMSSTENNSNVEENDDSRPFKRHHFSRRGRGRRGNHFRNRGNFIRHTRMQCSESFPRRNANDLSSHGINNGLSSNFSSVNIQSN